MRDRTPDATRVIDSALQRRNRLASSAATHPENAQCAGESQCDLWIACCGLAPGQRRPQVIVFGIQVRSRRWAPRVWIWKDHLAEREVVAGVLPAQLLRLAARFEP